MSQIEGGSPLQQARNAWVRRDIWQARVLIERAAEIGTTGSDLARTRLLAGVIYREIGDWNLALRHLTNLTANWSDYPDEKPLLEGPALYNLALVHYQRRNLTAAVAGFEQAIAEFRREGMKTYQRMAMQNLAWVYCELGQSDEAAALMDAIRVEHLIDSGDGDANAKQHLIAAYCSFLDGDYISAIKVTDKLVMAQTPDDVRAYAYWIAGRVAVAIEDLPGAELLAASALEAAAKTADVKCMSDVSRLRVLIAKAKGGVGA